MSNDSGKLTAMSTRLPYRSAINPISGRLPHMAIDPDRVRARLQIVKKSAAAASLEAGMSKDGIRNILRGATTHGRSDTMAAIAAVLECSVAYLQGETDDVGSAPQLIRSEIGSQQVLPVKYEVGAGYWVEADDRQTFFGHGDVIASPRYAGFPQWLERVIGDSMDREYEPGTFLRVVDAGAISYAPRHGDHVILERRRDGGHRIERSVKEVVINRGRVELWPRSNNPRWSSAVNLTDGAQEGDEIEVAIVGLVISSHRERH